MKHQLGRLLSHSTLILKGNGAMCVRSRWPVNFQQKIEGGLLVDSLEFGKSSIETVIWLHGGSISLEKVSEVIWYCILQEMGTESSWKNWSGLNVFQHHLIGFWSINSLLPTKAAFPLQILHALTTNSIRTYLHTTGKLNESGFSSWFLFSVWKKQSDISRSRTLNRWN